MLACVRSQTTASSQYDEHATILRHNFSQCVSYFWACPHTHTYTHIDIHTCTHTDANAPRKQARNRAHQHTRFHSFARSHIRARSQRSHSHVLPYAFAGLCGAISRIHTLHRGHLVARECLVECIKHVHLCLSVCLHSSILLSEVQLGSRALFWKFARFILEICRFILEICALYSGDLRALF
jgi:hypothetical protein